MTTPPSGHVLIAPDKFKGSLSAFQVAERTAAGLVRAALPGRRSAPGSRRRGAEGPAATFAVTAGLFRRLVTAAYGIVHFWLDAPLQLHICSWVPLVVLPLGSSRHLPEVGLTRAPFWAFHCWLAPPLQVHSSTRVPLL